MHVHLKFLIEWPTQETCYTNISADQGFDIGDDIAVHGAKLVIPSFT